MRRPTSRLTAAIVCVVLATGACSDGDEGGGETASTTTEATAGPTTTADAPTTPTTETVDSGPTDPAAEAAMDRAEALNLTIDDFPSGWQNLPPSEAEVGVTELCTTVDLDEHLVALARSDAFSYSIEPGTLQASTAVTVLDDEAAAVDLVGDFRDDAFVRCATEQLARDTERYAVSGTLARNDTAPDLGDEAVALSGDFTVEPTDGSPPHTLSAVVVAVRRGDTVVTFSTSAMDRGFDEETTRTLLTTIDERLESAG